MKIRPVKAEFFHADGQRDMKLIVAFCNFANAHKNSDIKIVMNIAVICSCIYIHINITTFGESPNLNHRVW